MQKGSKSPPTSRDPSPTTVKEGNRVAPTLIQVKSLAQALFCTAAVCVADNKDLVVQQFHSFSKEEEEDEGVEIGEESLLRKEYGIYRV